MWPLMRYIAAKVATTSQVDLLIIDDFGLKPPASPANEDSHYLIAERYERSATIVTGNLDFTEWGNALPNKLPGAATLNRFNTVLIA